MKGESRAEDRIGTSLIEIVLQACNGSLTAFSRGIVCDPEEPGDVLLAEPRNVDGTEQQPIFAKHCLHCRQDRFRRLRVLCRRLAPDHVQINCQPRPSSVAYVDACQVALEITQESCRHKVDAPSSGASNADGKIAQQIGIERIRPAERAQPVTDNAKPRPQGQQQKFRSKTAGTATAGRGTQETGQDLVLFCGITSRECSQPNRCVGSRKERP